MKEIDRLADSGHLEILMKITLLCSLLCLVIGYFAGQRMLPEPHDPPHSPVVRSSRSRTPRDQGRRHPPRLADQALNLTIENYRELSHERRALFTAGHLGRLSTLTLEEIPEALEVLLAKEREEAGGDVPHDISEEMLVLLARWYELDGDSVLNWISHSSEWDRSSIFKAQLLNVLDGFHRDPEGSFASMMGIQRTTRANNLDEDADPFKDGYVEDGYVNVSSFDSDILYEIGRWSDRPLEMLKLLDPTGEYLKVYESPVGDLPSSGAGLGGLSLGFPVTRSSPTTFSWNDEMKAFARGLIDSGQHELARNFLRDLEGGAKEAFQEVIGENAAKGGWHELKAQIDNGALDLASPFSSEVLAEFAQTDRQAALDWWLSLPEVEGVDRQNQITEAVTSSTFEIEPPQNDDPFANPKTDFVSAIEWLNKLETQGEPVKEAIRTLHHEAMRQEEWEVVRKLHQRLPEPERKTIEEQLVLGASNLSEESFRGEKIAWSKPGGIEFRAAEELGLLDQVYANSEETNARSRATLRSLLEKLESEATQ